MENVDTLSERNRLDVLSMMVEGSTDMRSNGAAGHETWSNSLYQDDELEFQLDLVKLDKSHNGKPSKVVHIRNIPNEISEAEIIHLGLPFGRVTNVLVLKGKNQCVYMCIFDKSGSNTTLRVPRQFWQLDQATNSCYYRIPRGNISLGNYTQTYICGREEGEWGGVVLVVDCVHRNHLMTTLDGGGCVGIGVCVGVLMPMCCNFHIKLPDSLTGV
ncbi:hypothetical protein M0804_005835 [Polistes exclamans]|nr:hypothetical protein M0804_005835 [Polistes exclamans]